MCSLSTAFGMTDKASLFNTTPLSHIIPLRIPLHICVPPSLLPPCSAGLERQNREEVQQLPRLSALWQQHLPCTQLLCTVRAAVVAVPSMLLL